MNLTTKLILSSQNKDFSNIQENDIVAIEKTNPDGTLEYQLDSVDKVEPESFHIQPVCGFLHLKFSRENGEEIEQQTGNILKAFIPTDEQQQEIYLELKKSTYLGCIKRLLGDESVIDRVDPYDLKIIYDILKKRK